MGNIILNAAKMKKNQSLSDVQRCADVATHATLEAEELVSHTKTVIVDTITSLHGSDGQDILVSEVLDLVNKIHGIVDKAVSKWVGNIAHSLS